MWLHHIIWKQPITDFIIRLKNMQRGSSVCVVAMCVCARCACVFTGVACLQSLFWYNLLIFHSWLFARVLLWRSACNCVCARADQLSSRHTTQLWLLIRLWKGLTGHNCLFFGPVLTTCQRIPKIENRPLPSPCIHPPIYHFLYSATIHPFNSVTLQVAISQRLLPFGSC